MCEKNAMADCADHDRYYRRSPLRSKTVCVLASTIPGTPRNIDSPAQ